ncbi:MAG: NAD-dependent epimerase/dehydratase family protein [Clostridiaceae bacterium]|nr:NAD-dependent epimerase/dehydratase family protein [Clostridiaceae bacterium]
MDKTILESKEDAVLLQDLEELAADGFPTEQMKGCTVLVTGATGLIGSQAVKALACCNRLRDTGIEILASVRSEEKAKKVFGNLLDRGDVKLVLGDISEPIQYSGRVDYIIHGASPTSSRFFVNNPVETILIAINGTKNVLEFAKRKEIKGMVYLSSLEVYGTPDENAGLIAEDYYGYIDPLQIRSSYSEGKRINECLCASYAAEYQVPVKIARLSQTFGAGVEYQDGRVFAEFMRCAMEKKDIVLHTAGKTVRSYCYTKDAVSALFYIMLKGNVGEAYNVTNRDTRISICDMAQLVCDTFPEAGISVTFDMPEDVSSFGYNPEMIVALDNTKLCALGWQATTDLAGMFRKMRLSIEQRRGASDIM